MAAISQDQGGWGLYSSYAQLDLPRYMHTKNEKHPIDGDTTIQTNRAVAVKCDKHIQVPQYMWDVLIIARYLPN